MAFEPRSEPGAAASALDGLGELIGDALRHGQELVRAEIALAKDELKTEIGSAKYAFAAFAIAVVLLNCALLVGALAVVMVLGLRSGFAFVVAACLLALAALVALLGTRLLHAPEMRRTKSRIARDARVLAHAAERPGR